MTQLRIAVWRVGLMLVALSAEAAVHNAVIRIAVLDSETSTVVVDNSGVPRNCDAVNFDAYCHNTRTTQVTNTLLVQEGSQPPFRVACTVDSKWSRCAPLPKGETFDAKRAKHGLQVYFADDHGKLRQQLYTYLDGEPLNPAAAATAPRIAPVHTASQTKGGSASSSAAPVVAPENVKCTFTSTPSGAEVTVDGRFVGSTPSVLNLAAGNHVVQVTSPGLAPWRRELTVSSGSEVTVNAVLQTSQ